MKRVFFVVILLLVAQVVTAFERVRNVVGFEENSSELNAEAKRVLDQFRAYNEDFIVEKVDIVSLCAPGEQSFHFIKLSRERSKAVYQYLTGILPDGGNYELRYFDSAVRDEELDVQNDCVVITAYLLHEDAPELEDAPRELFPEEFGDRDIPKSMLAQSPTTTSARSAKRSKEESGQKFTLQNIYFKGNSALYASSSEETLEEVLKYVAAYPEYKVLLIGHVNGRMGRRYLKKAAESNPERKLYRNAEHLSLARAESIRDYLVEHGIDASRIRCEGRGGKERIYRNPKNEKQNKANRRIEIVLIP